MNFTVSQIKVDTAGTLLLYYVHRVKNKEVNK